MRTAVRRNRSRWRPIKLGLSVVALAIMGSVRAGAAPFIPARDEQVLEQIPARLNGTLLTLRAWRVQLARQPSNLSLATELARSYIEIGRAELDPRYFGYAQAALEPWWAWPSPPPEVLVLRAILKQHRHDFAGALADLEALLQRDPRNAQAWLTRAVILQVQGHHRQALADCVALVYSPGTQFLGTVCLGKSLSLSGQAATASRLLGELLDRQPDAPQRERLWALTVLAETAARQGRSEQAELNFQRAFALGLRDSYLLTAYADFLLDERHPQRVKELLIKETRADGLLLRLAIAEQQLDSANDEHVASLKGRFAASRLRGDTVHLGDEARFTLHLLHDPHTALELALANWATQREPRDARIVLEAALAAREPASANPVLAALRDSSLEDVRLAALVARLEPGRP
jgi:hypothetical protein